MRGKGSRSHKVNLFLLLYKKGNNGSLDNWRPISFLNIDYKIAARVLSIRLQPNMPSIISADQNGFVKGRMASENIRLVQDVIDYCKLANIDGIILFLDFKKAFDNVNHSYLIETWKRMHFKVSFIGWIKALYTNAHGRVSKHGWLSKTFYIQKGVRQGCPVSASLFIVVAEILANKIRENNKIRGINITTKDIEVQRVSEVKITQFADDTTLFVNSMESVDNVMKELDDFE